MNKRVYGDISFKVNWQGEIVAIQPRARVWRDGTNQNILN
ncbi:hypothetical protein DOT_3851 [Desulfosporosinus sp. OT]|nr:hypothetical protein DOT_3851 [Desulfosporosinus sp. OT]